MRVLLRAPLLTNSGYGVHSRQIFEWLNEKKGLDLTVECLKWGNTPWLINAEIDNGLIGKIMSKSKPIEGKFDLAIQVQLPDEWDPSLANKNVGVSAFVETDRCNPKWIEACNKMDMIIVPSNFTKNVAKRSGILMTPIFVIPEWFNENITTSHNDDNETLQDDRFQFAKDFNFLIISQYTGQTPQEDRKNIYNAIKWTLEEFQNENSVGLVIKTNMGRGTTIDRKITVNTLKQMLRSINVKNKKGKVTLIHGNMSSKEIACLYKHSKVKCLVSPTRGEGYGLPLVDAAAAGMPVVATNKTGHLDFLKIADKDENYFLPVDFSMIDIPKTKIDNRIFLEGFKWCNPDEISFKKNIRNVFQNYRFFKERSGILKENVNTKFSKNNVKKMYDNLIFDG